MNSGSRESESTRVQEVNQMNRVNQGERIKIPFDSHSDESRLKSAL